ncbi:hypothetical protein [Otariodibacter oris]|uniref:hypothetical protein n=1 Tax=Otariodibacter oris TaxID=1032623 RepID=UPI000EABAA5B|nr:hypothetical protein [Otariodibacter oris]QGM80651.1 hypothetical protein A6A10_04160 [Otariodibacter oris]
MTKKNYCTGLKKTSQKTNNCCHQHDRDYGVKGTVSRSEADRRLRVCMIQNNKPVQAWVFWVVVRLFGWFFFKKKKEKHK